MLEGETMWIFTASTETTSRWMQVCTMDGFLELESLNSLTRRLSETAAWYETFKQHAEQAVGLDAVGNGRDSEVLYPQCKIYLEQAAEGDQDAVEYPGLAIALCWVYLALANLYRYILMDYWKAIECLLMLLSTRTKIASSSDGLLAPLYIEIRFALCLTVFEWVDVLVECHNPAREAVLVVPLEEVRDVVNEWKTLNDAEVASSLAHTLSRGYAKLRRYERVSYWKQRLTDLTMQLVTTGDQFLDSLPRDSSVEFQTLPKNMKICLNKFRKFGAMAKTATTAGNILAAEDCYKQCEAAVKEAGDEMPTSKKGILLQWIYERLGHIYRFDIVDLEKAVEYYRACLSAMETIKSGNGLGPNIIELRLIIIELMYEKAHNMDDVSLDEERRKQLVAEAVQEGRKLFAEAFNGSVTDLDVKNTLCCLLRHRYEECGRVGEAFSWNEERLKLMNKNMPLFDEVRLRSAYLQDSLGEYEKASKIVTSLKKKLKENSTKESIDAVRSLANLPFVSMLNRDLYHRRYNENPESRLPAMTEAAIDDERKDESRWAKKFLDIDLTQNVQDEIAKEMTRQNLLLFEGKQLMSEGKLMEAVDCFHRCLKLISEGHADNILRLGFKNHEDDILKIECLSDIGVCHQLLVVQAIQLELESGAGAFPGNAANRAHTYHYCQSLGHLQKALEEAERRNDIYRMAYLNNLLGFLLFTNWKLVLPRHDKLSDEGYMCLRRAVNFFKASGRNLGRFLHALKDPDKLWVSVLERHDAASIAYYQIQRSIYEIVALEEQRMVAKLAHSQSEVELRKFLGDANIWRSQALLWAERGHSRTLAFKLTERSKGKITRLELKKFDMNDWGEAWASIIESGDVCGPGTVMVEYIKVPKKEDVKGNFFIYVVTKDRLVDMKLQDKPEEDLGILLTTLNCHMSQKVNSKLQHQEVIQILEDLYEAFISPIQPLLDSMEEHHKLVICANKILAGVPFAALRNPHTKKFLIERHTIACTPSLRILKECDQRLKALQRLPLMESTGAALVLGDPAFSLNGSDRLEASGKEADTIADILGHPNVLVLKGKNASKKEVLKWIQMATTSEKYQALMHLATHGKGVDDNFKEGALEFSDPNVQTWPINPTSESTDLQHSMSNLSKQSDFQVKRIEDTSNSTSVYEQVQVQEPAFHSRGHNGPRRSKVDPRHLTAEEIVKDYEWRTLLVVLSACETAKGEVKSEGTLNLARALLISGVPSTIVSQWKVDDASAPILMAGLYKAMVSGMDVASALRTSMMTMIKDNYHVHQWAPFVVTGLGTVSLPKFLQFPERQLSETKT